MEELVQSYQLNKEDALFQEIYDEVKPYVMNWLMSKIGSRGISFHKTDLEEVFHDALLKALPTFKWGNFRIYLISVAHNTLLDKLRFNQRRPFDPCGENLEIFFGGEDLQLEDSLVDEYLFMLTEEEVKFYLDLKVNGFTLERMSAREGLTIKQVRTRAEKITKKIKTELAKYYE